MTKAGTQVRWIEQASALIGWMIWTALAGSCSSAGTTDTGTTSTAGTPATIVKIETPTEVSEDTEGLNEMLAVNPYVISYPIGFGVALWPEVGDSLGSLEKRLADENEVLLGTQASCEPKVIQKQRAIEKVKCYDEGRGMVYTTNGTTLLSGTLDGYDANKEPCLISASRERTFEVVDRVNQAFAMIQATLCEIRKSELTTLPEPGDTFNVKQEAERNLPLGGESVLSATVAYVALSDDRPSFQIDLSYGLTSGGRFDIHMAHRPKSKKANDQYEGVLWLSHVENSEAAKTTPKDLYISLNYARYAKDPACVASDDCAAKGSDSSTDAAAEQIYLIQGRILAAKMVPSLATKAFGVDGVLQINPYMDGKGNLINPETKVYYPNQEEAMKDISLIEFERDLKDETGTIQYWHNKNPFFAEAASGMVFKLSLNADGKLGGCGISGISSREASADLSIRAAVKHLLPLKPSGFFHPTIQTDDEGSCRLDALTFTTDTVGEYFYKSCPDSKYYWYKPKVPQSTWATIYTSATRGSLISKQCFVKNTDGVFKIDTAQTTAANGYHLLDALFLSDAETIPPPDGDRIKTFTTKTK